MLLKGKPSALRSSRNGAARRNCHTPPGPRSADLSRCHQLTGIVSSAISEAKQEMPMQCLDGIGLADVQAVYSGAEGDLWELIMGEQIHIGGLAASMDLAQQAGIQAGSSGVDLCCCTGAGMRFLVRFRHVARMTGVDATPRSVERGRQRCQDEGLDGRIEFVQADACATGLPDAGGRLCLGRGRLVLRGRQAPAHRRGRRA